MIQAGDSLVRLRADGTNGLITSLGSATYILPLLSDGGHLVTDLRRNMSGGRLEFLHVMGE